MAQCRSILFLDVWKSLYRQIFLVFFCFCLILNQTVDKKFDSHVKTKTFPAVSLVFKVNRLLIVLQNFKNPARWSRVNLANKTRTRYRLKKTHPITPCILPRSPRQFHSCELIKFICVAVNKYPPIDGTGLDFGRNASVEMRIVPTLSTNSVKCSVIIGQFFNLFLLAFCANKPVMFTLIWPFREKHTFYHHIATKTGENGKRE